MAVLFIRMIRINPRVPCESGSVKPCIKTWVINRSGWFSYSSGRPLPVYGPPKQRRVSRSCVGPAVIPEGCLSV